MIEGFWVQFLQVEIKKLENSFADILRENLVLPVGTPALLNKNILGSLAGSAKITENFILKKNHDDNNKVSVRQCGKIQFHKFH